MMNVPYTSNNTELLSSTPNHNSVSTVVTEVNYTQYGEYLVY